MNLKYLVIACIFYCLLFCLLFPFYRYLIDLDATGYINVARSFAIGDYHNSINGWWSPLGSWLLVPSIKLGFDPVITAKYINGMIGLFSVICFYYLMQKMLICDQIKNVYLLFVVIILIYFVFFELFADLLQVLILLIYLNLVCSKNFIHTIWKLGLCGFIGAVGYYSKYYTFYFFLFNFSITCYLLSRNENKGRQWFFLLKGLAVTFTVLLVMVVPWWYALSHKYGKFTISTVGKLNITWRLTPIAEYERVLISPPPYPAANSDWDDPSYLMMNLKDRSPFDNTKYFIEELKIITGNIRTMLNILNEFSFLSMCILLMGLYLAFKRKKIFITNMNNLIILSFILTMPLGYLLIRIEERFIWTVGICLFTLSAVMLSISYELGWIRQKFLIPTALIICCSFIFHPVDLLLDLRYSGKEIFEMAEDLKKNKIEGKLMSKWYDPGLNNRTGVLCFLSGNKSYGPRTPASDLEQLQVIKENAINYYLWYYQSEDEKNRLKQSPLAIHATKLYENIHPGLMIAEFK